MARKRLLQMFQAGDDAIIPDPQGGAPETVWLQKLGGPDIDAAIRRANAARAKVQTEARDPDSEAYQSALADVYDIGDDRDTFVEFLIAEQVALRTLMAEYQLEYDEEGDWGKDGYLEGLRDAWEDGLGAAFEADPDDPEAKRVADELSRFLDEVAERIGPVRDELRSQYDNVDLDQLRHLTVRQFLETIANQVWQREFERARLFLALRDPADRSRFYLDARAEVDLLPDDVIADLNARYEAMSVEGREGKDSRATASSSPPSPSPAPAEESPLSGPAAATG